jgi:hypothetical protein
MSYEFKIEKAKSIISSHNSVARKKVEFETFLGNLQDAGGTTDDALKSCTWEDLEKFGLPTLIAKQVCSAFRSKEEEKVERKAISEKKAQAMTAKELFEHYDPRNWDNFVGKKLKELADSKRCVVFNEDGSVNVDVSAKLVDELRDGFPEREQTEVNEVPFKVYHVGERVDQFAFENPLYPGTLLRPDETCTRTNRSWNGVCETIRVLLYLASKETKELRIRDEGDVHDAIDMAGTEDAEKKLRRRYPKASILYNELKAAGNLPTLRLLRSQQKKPQDPFFSGHKRY